MIIKGEKINKRSLTTLENRCSGNYKKALEKYNFTCAFCNSTMDVMVHHKDRNVKNNSLDNLVCLCRSCHAIEHQGKMKFGRPSREIIQELRLQGLTYSRIGEYLGVSRQRIHQILSNKYPYKKGERRNA